MSLSLFQLLSSSSGPDSWFSYPIDDLSDSRIQQLLGQSRESLADVGVFKISQFLSAEGVALLQERILSVQHKGNWKNRTKNVFQDAGDVDNFNSEHSRNHKFTYSISFVGKSSLTTEFLDLYNFEPLLRFLEAVVTETHHESNDTLDCKTYEHLYLSGSEEGSVYGYIAESGDSGAWHFDQHPFSCVWMLSTAGQGGALRYRFVPPAKDARHTTYQDTKLDYDWDLLYDILIDDKEDEFQRLRAAQGDIYCFKGNITVHMVEPVSGDTTRAVLVTAYADYPHFTHISEIDQINDWGKTEL